ncbi:MAG TPA: hypothetical protein VHC69_17745 [Polyangiaceae bacterium]|nr:hypothetical protein [Polyangiaceae bacterium]
MPDVLLPATSGRAKCRGCGRAIKTGELRFGESAPNAYGEGETFYWFHPTCAACMRPEKFAAMLRSTPGVPDRDWLEKAVEEGTRHHRLARLARAERSKSGKARCRSCREPIESGVMRFALSTFEEGGRMSPIGFIHVECARAYFGTTDVMERVEKLSPDLDAGAIAEVAERLQHQREGVPDEDDSAGREGPDVVKAQGPAGSDEAKRA